jgi:prepilin-type N-terminal cleavage/methylation domain-containing protein
MNPMRLEARPARVGGRAYTLVEVLVVVVVMGIAGALVVPAFTQTGVLRVQGAVRLIISDITTAQSDAVAYQAGRAIVFYPGQRSYKVAETHGSTLDLNLDLIDARSFAADGFGDANIAATTLNGTNTLCFDEMGSPITAPGSGVAAPNGTITVTGSGQTFRITIEAYTGRATVTALSTSQGN